MKEFFIFSIGFIIYLLVVYLKYNVVYDTP